MSDQNTQQEPSMEEILASIRRIISEDGEEAAPAPKPAARAPAPPPEPESEPEPETDSEPDEIIEEEVLELTEDMAADDEVLELQSDDEVADEFGADDEGEVELEMVDEFDSPEDAADGEPEPDFEQESPAKPAAAPGGPMDAISAAVEERLISSPPASESVSSLASLVAAVDTHRRAVDPSIGPKTIEDLVKEVMRPMIREWLDGNLPALVERLVRREIQRLMNDAEQQSER